MHDPQIEVPQGQSLFYSPQKFKQDLINQMRSNHKQEETQEEKVKDQVRMVVQGRVEEPDQSMMDKCTSMCTINYYKEYFDITTKLFLKRFINAFNPLSGTFFQIGGGKPDLYGPFWILTTLILEMAAFGNIAAFQQTPAGFLFQYQYKMLPIAALIIYVKAIAFPLIVKALLKCFQCDTLSLVQLICLFGYANSIVCLVTIFQVIHNEPLQWCLFLYAIFNTTLFLVTNLHNEFAHMERDQQKYLMIGIVAGLQVSIMVAYKVYFFRTFYINPIAFPRYRSNAIDDKHLYNNI